jgi:hypothetical protein
MWQPRTITDLTSDATGLVASSPEEAQHYCNFPIFFPDRLPAAGMHCNSFSLRKECIPGRTQACSDGRSSWSKANNCSIRFELTDGSTRIRLKQFLYDWAPPAADQPNLWKSVTCAHALTFPYVVWIGTDYKGHRGAYARMGRTSCELSVLEGEIADTRLVELYGALRVSGSSEQITPIYEASLARLSYWSRYRPGLVNAPYALWRFRRSRQHEKYSWSDAPLTDYDDGLPLVTLAGFEDFELDSIGNFGAGTAREREVVFTAGHDRGREVRVIYYRSGGDQDRLGPQPTLEGHPCTAQTMSIAGRQIRLAFISEHHGPYNAVLEDEGRGIKALVCTSAAQNLGFEWFLDLITHLDFT